MRVHVGRREDEVEAGGRAPIPVDGRGPHERLLTVATVVVVVLAALLVWVVTFTPLWAGQSELPARGGSARGAVPAEAAP